VAGTFRGGDAPSRAPAPPVLTSAAGSGMWVGKEVILMPAKKKAAKKRKSTKKK
jgi:hypothetical protein